MDTVIRNFCKKYKEKLYNDKDIKENKTSFVNDYRDRINFYVLERTNNPNTYYIGGVYHGDTLFCLDEEDLKYLYNKYSKKIKEERDKNIEDIKEEYKDIL